MHIIDDSKTTTTAESRFYRGSFADSNNPIWAVRTQGAEEAAGHRDAVETVMLVDDEEGVRKIASIALRRHGYKVLEASDGDTAAEMLAAPAMPKIDLLLSDIRMTGTIGGHELAELFFQKYPDAPVLLMSGARPNESGRDPRVSYIAKPFTVYSLPAEVRKAIGAAALRIC